MSCWRPHDYLQLLTFASFGHLLKVVSYIGNYTTSSNVYMPFLIFDKYVIKRLKIRIDDKNPFLRSYTYIYIYNLEFCDCKHVTSTCMLMVSTIHCKTIISIDAIIEKRGRGTYIQCLSFTSSGRSYQKLLDFFYIEMESLLWER